MKRPSPALVVACLALFVALGGTSYAALKLPKNSVGSKQIKKNAVTSDKVKNGSLIAKDFKSGQLPAGAKGDPGPSASGAAFKNNTAISSWGQIVALSSGDTKTGKMSIGFNARVVVTADVEIYNTNAGDATVLCKAEESSDGTTWNFVDGSLVEHDARGDSKDSVIAFTGAFEAVPGTYDVRVACSSGPATNAWRASITAIATAR